jgi:Arginine deiminase
VPALAFTLTALSITAKADELRVSRPRPFLEAAADALGTDRLTVIDTGLDSRCATGTGQWDDGGNALAIGPRLAVCNERHVETNARLADAGFQVIAVPGNELGAFRGGPRGMCAAIHRDPAVRPVDEIDERATHDDAAAAAGRPELEPGVLPVPAMTAGAPVPEPAADNSGRVSQLTPLG